LKSIRLGMIAAVLAATGAAHADVAPGKIDAIFAPWAGAQSPGCAISVEDHGKTTVRTYGSADLEHDVPIDAATVFEAGSVSKQFTAMATLLLVEQGKVALSDDVHKFIPELPDYGAPITVEQLLTHTSGLRDWGEIVGMEGWERSTRAMTSADMLDVILRQRSLNYAPGATYSYTNTGFNLLGLIVERVSGQSLQAFTQEQMFGPLGMTHTQWRDDFRRVVKKRAVAYSKTEGGWEQLMPFENPHGHGGLLTTVGDLQIWNHALDQRMMRDFIAGEMEHQGKLNDGRTIPYARGLVVSRYNGEREVAHGGATAGYRAYLARYPERDLSLALLCNAGSIRPDDLAHKVVDLYLPPVSSTAQTIKGVTAGKAGLFVHPVTGVPITLTVEGDTLVLGERGAMTAIDATGWRGDGASVVFDGNDAFVLTTDSGTVARYTRASPAAPTSAELGKIAGRYASDEVRATYRVRRDGNHLVLALEGRPEMVNPLVPSYRDAFLAGDLLVRVRRNKAGEVEGLSFGTSRAWDVRFKRVD
jgi:CubicO group peptidase (beta-lactamase class C family)